MAEENTGVTDPQDAKPEESSPPATVDDPKPNTSSDAEGVQKKINKLTKNWRDAQRETEYWRGVAEANKRASESPPSKEKAPAPLNRDEFESDAAYEAAVEERVAKRVLKTVQSDREKEDQARKGAKIVEYTEAGREKYSDYDEVALPASMTSR